LTKKRVVVTGLGLVTPVGNNVQDSWSAIKAGKSGVRAVDAFDASAIASQISASVKDFDVTPYMSVKDARKSDVFIQYGMGAAAQAIADSGIEVTEENAHRIGIAAGSGIGGLPMIEKCRDLYTKGGPRKVSPFFIPATIINMLAGNLSIKHGFKGPNISVVTACTTGTHNIGLAARTIAYGDADVMLCGGSEMATSELGLSGFSAMRALSTRNDDPESASRPWDKNRDGFVLGDGAGMMMLESYEHAKARGATIYAELSGFGMSADAFHMTMPSPEGAQFSMRNALNDGGLNSDAVDYVNAHGTSTPVGDVNESNAVKQVFASTKDKIAMSSTKSMIGHLLGAAGAVEAVFCVLAIRDQLAPPTINLDNPDEGCDLNYVAHTAQERQIKVALSNSFGFGGTNASLIFSQLD